MEDLNIEQFNPTVAELTALADGYKDLAITGPDDKEGYQRVHKARLDLRDRRVSITKQGKALRDKVNAFNKAVIARENELVAIVEPIETTLKERQEAVDLEIEKLKRVALLPERRAKCDSIGLVVTDDNLLAMEPEHFAAWFNENHGYYLDRKAQEVKEAEERIEAEKRAEQDRKDAEARAAETAAIEAKRKEDEDKRIEAAKAQAIIDQKKRDEQAAAEQKAKEEREQAELEGKKKYQDFLNKHGALTPENKVAEGFVIQQNGKTLNLYKLVGTITV